MPNINAFSPVRFLLHVYKPIQKHCPFRVWPILTPGFVFEQT